MPNITYPHAVKYKGRYYTAGEEIKASNSNEQAVAEAVSEAVTEAQPKPIKRRTAKKQVEADISEP